MPAKSEDQRKVAAAELARRRKGAKKQKDASRPFGSASMKDLRDFVAKKGK